MGETTAVAINKQLKKILIWLPLILGVCALIGLALTVRGIYDNDVAKKSDIDRVSMQVSELSKQMSDMSIRFNVFKTGDSITKLHIKVSADSLAKAVVAIEKACSRINRKVGAVAYYTQKYSTDNNNRVLPGANKFIPHNK